MALGGRDSRNSLIRNEIDCLGAVDRKKPRTRARKTSDGTGTSPLLSLFLGILCRLTHCNRVTWSALCRKISRGNKGREEGLRFGFEYFP